MPSPARPQVVCRHLHPSLFVADVRSAVDYYVEKLGFEPGFTWGEPPSIAGVNLGDVQLFLRQGRPSPAGCVVQFVVDDADALAGALERVLTDARKRTELSALSHRRALCYSDAQAIPAWEDVLQAVC